MSLSRIGAGWEYALEPVMSTWRTSTRFGIEGQMTDYRRGFVCNPFFGCLGPKNDGVMCPYCYLTKWPILYKPGTPPKYNPKALEDLAKVALRKEPTTVVIGSSTDMFGEWVDSKVWVRIFYMMVNSPQHIFILLTKQPQNILEKIWGSHQKETFVPENKIMGISHIYLGVTVTSPADLWRIDALRESWPGKKWVSFEPYLEFIPEIDLTDIDWLVIGAQTRPDKGLPGVASPFGGFLNFPPVFFKSSMAKYGFKLEGNQNIPWLKG